MKLILGYIIIDICKTWLAFVYGISVFVIIEMILLNNNNNKKKKKKKRKKRKKKNCIIFGIVPLFFYIVNFHQLIIMIVCAV